ncbi:phosphodiester glycosidase family protein [Phormidium sp. CLA17]|uniref:phosphodiester glycosidase family protein n=1 Tax=Leptolyngbya sp. Cla-17 TaxID=2803751 RepID=UPI001491F73D|nr:phosphodiester glycosidase family protein [Leptolyngbya sp. Cla-17]MBM0743639.1 phosphodiester glycosidase family protein [Leptolyngbya sp. Cla-17]
MNFLFKIVPTLVGISILSLPIAGFGWMVAQRPPQSDLKKMLFPGVEYRREFRQLPRPVMIHIIALDLTASGIQALVTPGKLASDNRELNARTASEFLQDFKLQVAVNASFFYPFAEESPWNYFPHSGDRVNAVGLAISNGRLYSPAESGWAALCLMAHRAQIVANGECPKDTTQAVAGNAMVVAEGKPTVSKTKTADSDGIYARTAVAIDQQGEKLWLIVVDGKQWLYSEGVTLAELAQIAIQIGADAAVNLDGGGSTTLVVETPTGATVLNSPVHTKIPMRERPVANHLGFYARPARSP